MIANRVQLGDLMRQLDLPMRAAELGVAEGQYAHEMLRWGLDKLYLVDLWKHVDGMTAELGNPDWDHEAVLQECMERLRPYAQQITVLRGWAHEMAEQVPDESLGLFYEDTTHKKEWVLKNLEAWYPKLVPGGLVAGHDYLGPGLTVKPAVDEFAARVGAEVCVIPENGPHDASFWFAKP
jgi:hypothetical protein